MNRRHAIRKAVGMGAGLAALPILATGADAAPTSVYGGGPPTCSPTGPYTPPPPDTRTPEQVLLDQDKAEIAGVIHHLTGERYPGQRKYAYAVPDLVFDAVQAEVRTQSLPIETRLLAGVGVRREILVGSNGNIIRRADALLYFV